MMRCGFLTTIDRGNALPSRDPLDFEGDLFQQLNEMPLGGVHQIQQRV